MTTRIMATIRMGHPRWNAWRLEVRRINITVWPTAIVYYLSDNAFIYLVLAR